MADRKEKRGHEDRKSSSNKSTEVTNPATSRSKSSSNTSNSSKSTSASSKTTTTTDSTLEMPRLSVATGVTNCPAESPSPLQSTSGEQQRATDARIDDLYRMMHCFMQKMVGEDEEHDEREDAHRMSDSDDGEISDNDDPFDQLSVVINNMSDPAVKTHDTGDDYNQVLADLAASFHYEEEKGEALGDDLAKILNATLRKKPIDSNVKTTASQIKLPVNVPNLTVPATNADIAAAMDNDGKKIDSNLTQINNLIARAIVPIATFVNGIGSGAVKEPKAHLSSMNNAIRLLVAAFNYLNQTRKLTAKAHIKEESLGKICKWEHEVGEKELFPFDVTKKIEEINKTKKLGSYKKNKEFTPFKAPRPTFRKAPFGSPYYKKRPSAQTGSAKPQGQSSRPFLGKSQNYKSHHRRY